MQILKQVSIKIQLHNELIKLFGIDFENIKKLF